jgi:hypothetical protein
MAFVAIEQWETDASLRNGAGKAQPVRAVRRHQRAGRVRADGHGRALALVVLAHLGLVALLISRTASGSAPPADARDGISAITVIAIADPAVASERLPDARSEVPKAQTALAAPETAVDLSASDDAAEWQIVSLPQPSASTKRNTILINSDAPGQQSLAMAGDGGFDPYAGAAPRFRPAITNETASASPPANRCPRPIRITGKFVRTPSPAVNEARIKSAFCQTQTSSKDVQDSDRDR